MGRASKKGSESRIVQKGDLPWPQRKQHQCPSRHGTDTRWFPKRTEKKKTCLFTGGGVLARSEWRELPEAENGLTGSREEEWGVPEKKKSI